MVDIVKDGKIKTLKKKPIKVTMTEKVSDKSKVKSGVKRKMKNNENEIKNENGSEIKKKKKRDQPEEEMANDSGQKKKLLLKSKKVGVKSDYSGDKTATDEKKKVFLRSKKVGVQRESSGDKTTTDEKKPNLAEMSYKDRKDYRKQNLKNNYDLIKRTKRMWEDLRRHDLDKPKRAKICTDLARIIRGRAKEMIFAHDTCRVVQCLMQYGDEKQRTVIFEELKDDIVEMTKSKYAKFFIRKIMKYGVREQKNAVFVAYHGKVKKLVRHAGASQILEYCYNDYANAMQRSSMVEEFYGPSYALFKTDEVRSLEQIMSAEPLKKESILSNMREVLITLVDKDILCYSLVHRIFNEYFTFATPKQRSEMIELLRDQLVPMLHTRDGARVAMYCIWHGTTKDRKAILKSLKTHVVKLCKEEYGHLVLLAVFDCVDDTKIVHKIILDEIIKSLDEVVGDAQGKKVLHYLLNRRNTKHFHPDIIKILDQGDQNAMSKKDPAIRSRELLQYASAKLYDHVRTNTRPMMEDSATLLLLLDVLTNGIGECAAALTSVAKIVAEPYPGDSPDTHTLVTPAGHMAIKRLIQHDKNKMADGGTDLFSAILLDNLDPGTLNSWTTCNRGCFTIINMLEINNDDVTKDIMQQLSKCKKSLAAHDFKGAQVLLEKIKKQG